LSRIAAIWLFAAGASAQTVTLQDASGAKFEAELKGQGAHAIVFVHGLAGPSGWENWPAETAAQGFLVLVLNNPGFDPRAVTAAAHHARAGGAKAISLVGASRGGEVIGLAAAQGEYAKLVYVSPTGVGRHDAVRGDKLMIIARGERDAHWMHQHFDKLPGPKRKLVVESSSHGHALVREKPELLRAILEFLAR
jgi:pimeloyl-ACP methyl ester carboxylesterase